MSAPAAPDAGPPAPPKRRSKLPLVLGLVLAALGGGGGFMAVQAGIVGGAHLAVEEAHEPEAMPLAPMAFVPLAPLVVNLPGQGERRFLRFAAQLEVAPEHEAEVLALSPRVVDVLNGYLRAVQVEEIEDPAALLRLRAQMLRRVQVVAGEGRIRDLLVMEFVVN